MDKITHFLAGFFIATCFQFLGIGMILPAILAGLGKEIYDKKQGRVFDLADLACTCAGGLLGWFIHVVLN